MLNIPYKAISLIKISTFFYYTYTHTRAYILSSISFSFTYATPSGYFFFFLLISSSIANTNASRTYIHNALRRRVDFPILFNLFITPFFFLHLIIHIFPPFSVYIFFCSFLMPFFFCHLGSSRARLLYVTAYMRPTIYPHLYKSLLSPHH